MGCTSYYSKSGGIGREGVLAHVLEECNAYYVYPRAPTNASFPY